MQSDRRTFIGGGLAGVTASLGAKLHAQPIVAPSPRAQRPILIRGADLLTMDPALGELPGTDVLIEDGKIAAIGKGLTNETAEVIEAGDMILMPGMCDGHRHLWLTVDAGHLVKTNPERSGGYPDFRLRTIVAMAPEDHYLVSLIGGLEAIDSGVTSVVDFPHVHYRPELALAAAQGVHDSGVGGWCAFQLGMNADYKPGDTISREAALARHVMPAEERHWAMATMLQAKVFSSSDAPMQLALAPAMFEGFEMEGIKAEFARARSMSVGLIACHINRVRGPKSYFNPSQQLADRDRFGTRGSGIYDLHDAGLLGPDFHLAHGNALDGEELKMLRDSGGMICSTVLGEFNYVARELGGPVHGRARAAGVAVGIGIDVPQAVTHDYFEHVRGAFWGLYLEPSSYDIAAAADSTYVLDFATRLGARALRLGDKTGTITVGKQADLVLLRTDRIGFATLGTLADRVVNFASLQDIDSVWVMGVPRKRNGKMLGVNWIDLKTRLAKVQQKVRQLSATIKIVPPSDSIGSPM
jgi:cytosine/adenosine deaminase-related metal-dependent hydrolase